MSPTDAAAESAGLGYTLLCAPAPRWPPGRRKLSIEGAEVTVKARRVVVGMSGGVDSSVAAALLKEQGYEVIGVTLSLSPKLTADEAAERDDACCTLAAVEDARRVADKLGIDHYCLNFREIFAERVIGNFIAEYRRGRTPNPCVRCNDHVKFEAVLRRARAMDADLVATGHYARIEHCPAAERHLLRKGLDPRKDQSYVLYVLTQDELAHTLLPLGELVKEQTRELARKLGLRVADKPESQEICFVVDDDYGSFLRRVAPEVVQPGPVLDLGGRVVGEHKGVAFYTIGQRRALGIATGQPLYVVDIDVRRSAVVVGPEEALYREEVLADDVNLIGVAALDEPIRVQAKVRYRMPAAEGWLEQPSADRLLLRFDRPQRAITPGQSLVCYQGDTVVGGGTILAAGPGAGRSAQAGQAGPASRVARPARR